MAKVVRIHALGGPEVLQIEDMPVGEPGAGEVRIRVEAVGLNRVPALVVVRPKDVAGAPPQAQVSYGFRSSQSVVQAVRDALYKGKDDVPYHPG